MWQPWVGEHPPDRKRVVSQKRVIMRVISPTLLNSPQHLRGSSSTKEKQLQGAALTSSAAQSAATSCRTCPSSSGEERPPGGPRARGRAPPPLAAGRSLRRPTEACGGDPQACGGPQATEACGGGRKVGGLRGARTRREDYSVGLTGRVEEGLTTWRS
jgi:hypothetical protein